MEKIEYRVVPVTRYFVARYESGIADRPSGATTKGEYDNENVAYQVGYALCKAEHESLGWPIGDMRIMYPDGPPRK